MKFASLLMLVPFMPVFAQQQPLRIDFGGEEVFSAGAKWEYEEATDSMTDARQTIFKLASDDQAGQGPATFVIFCGSENAPRWINSKLITRGIVGTAQTRSILGDNPAQYTFLRADQKVHAHIWTIMGDFHGFFVDRGSTKQILGSSDARLSYLNMYEQRETARFSPSGIDMSLLRKACGSLLK